MSQPEETSQIQSADQEVPNITILRYTEVQAVEDDISSIGTNQTEDLEIENDSHFIQISVRDHWNWNKARLEEERRNPSWEDVSIDDGRLVIKPTAANIKSHLLHPLHIRSLGAIGTVEGFASLMGVSDSWRTETESALQNTNLKLALRQFRGLQPQTLESIIEQRFDLLIQELSHHLHAWTVKSDRVNYAVAGLLAEGHYYVRGKTDLTYRHRDNTCRFKTEFKTDASFPLGHLWYHQSRGTQTLGCIYSDAERVPTLLLTQKQMKVFLERPDRKQLATYPSGHRTLLTRSREFLQILVICLLSARPEPSSPSSSLSFATPKRFVSPLPDHRPTEERASKRAKKMFQSDIQRTRLYFSDPESDSSDRVEWPIIARIDKQGLDCLDAIYGLVPDESEDSIPKSSASSKKQ